MKNTNLYEQYVTSKTIDELLFISPLYIYYTIFLEFFRN